MNSDRPTSAAARPRPSRCGYHSPLREEQKAGTRKRILDAVRTTIESRGTLERVSVAAVARSAGVQERTVYRHFATRERMIDAFFAHYSAELGVPYFARTEADVRSLGARLFVGFERDGAIHRAFTNSRGGREMFVRFAPQFQAAFQEAVAEAARDLPPQERRWLAAAANALSSGGAWRTLHDLWGMSGDEAGRVSHFALGLLLDGARARAAREERGRRRRSPVPARASSGAKSARRRSTPTKRRDT